MKNFSLEKSLSRKTVSRIYVSGCIHTHHGVGCVALWGQCAFGNLGSRKGSMPERYRSSMHMCMHM